MSGFCERDRELALRGERTDDQHLAGGERQAAEHDRVRVARQLCLREERCRPAVPCVLGDRTTLAHRRYSRRGRPIGRASSVHSGPRSSSSCGREREHTVPGTHESEARRRLRERIEREGKLVDGRIDLGVEAEGRLVGHVEARQPKQAMPRGVFELGISIFEAERGKGYGTRAVAALTDLLLDEHGAHRVQASTDVLNAAMRAVLEQLGYTFEGILRGFMPTQDGGRADYAMYGVTREDWEARAD